MPTSLIRDNPARDAPSSEVTLGWIIGNLRERSFGIVMLLIGLIGSIARRLDVRRRASGRAVGGGNMVSP